MYINFQSIKLFLDEKGESENPSERLIYLKTMKWFIGLFKSLTICKEQAQQIAELFEQKITNYNLYPKCLKKSEPLLKEQTILIKSEEESETTDCIKSEIQKIADANHLKTLKSMNKKDWENYESFMDRELTPEEIIIKQQCS